VEQKNGVDAGSPYSASRIVITGTSTVTRADLLGTRGDDGSAIESAVEFLREELAGGDQPVRDLQAAAKNAGLSWRTVERAKKALGIDAIRISSGDSSGYWEWHLSKTAKPLGGLGLGGLGGLAESPVTTGDSQTDESQDRQQNGVAALPSLGVPDIRDFMRQDQRRA
jgi:hypothetical protein